MAGAAHLSPESDLSLARLSAPVKGLRSPLVFTLLFTVSMATDVCVCEDDVMGTRVCV